MSKLPSYEYLAFFTGDGQENEKVLRPPGGRGSRYTPEQIWNEVREYTKHYQWITKIEVFETKSESTIIPEPTNGRK